MSLALKGRACKLLLFHRGRTYGIVEGLRKKRDKEELRDNFLNQTQIPDGEKELIREQILVTLNANIFTPAVVG